MNDENQANSVSKYVKSINDGTEIQNEYHDPYKNGLGSRMDSYVESTIAEESSIAEYEMNKIVKCRRYKLYKRNNS